MRLDRDGDEKNANPLPAMTGKSVRRSSVPFWVTVIISTTRPVTSQTPSLNTFSVTVPTSIKPEAVECTELAVSWNSCGGSFSVGSTPANDPMAYLAMPGDALDSSVLEERCVLCKKTSSWKLTSRSLSGTRMRTGTSVVLPVWTN